MFSNFWYQAISARGDGFSIENSPLAVSHFQKLRKQLILPPVDSNESKISYT